MNILTKAIIVGAVASFFIFIILFFWYSKDLPSPDKVQRHEGFSTVIMDRNNIPIYDIFNDKNRIPIPFSDLPDPLKKATISIEDKNFYTHQGFDPRGLVRALFNIVTFHGLQGGSTLTQQLVKNVLLTSEKSIPRKIKEFILAVQIERKYSKDEILQMYLNEAPYGGTMWGIESAASGYFGKHAKDLSLTESVILAGLPQSPSYYSPLGDNPKAYISRAEEVLRRMREDGYISPTKEYELKKSLPNVKFATESAQFKAPHFVFYVKNQLVEKFGEKLVDGGGLRVTTTLDNDLQTKAESIMLSEINKLKGLNVSNGAAVVINPQTGEILAYIGSKSYDDQDTKVQGQFDVASMGIRQPGSALKPITYAVGFMKGYTPATVLMDVDTKFHGGTGQKDYEPKNYDGKFRGPIQIRYALGNSINVPAVKMTALIGVRDILKTAYDMGLSTLEPTDDNIRKLGLSMVLGGGEVKLIDLVSAYGVFATGGVKNNLYSILKVTDATGKVLYEHQAVAGKQILGSDISFLISDILSDNGARRDVFGERSYLVIPGHTVAVKTGTTDDKKDNWTIGYNKSVAAGVWVGNNDNTPMNPKLASGTTGAAPIWNQIMQEVLKGKKDEPFDKPDNITSLNIDAFAGGMPHSGKPTRNEYFIKGTEPASESPIYKKIKLSKKDNNKLANNVEIATGAYDEKEFIVFTEDDPTSSGGENLWQSGIDAWLNTQSDPLYHPPHDMANTDEKKVVINIKTPSDMTKIDSNDISIRAEAKAIKDISKIEIYVDDDRKATVNNNVYDDTISIATGVHKIKAKAYDTDNNTGESEVTIGVKTSPEPTETPKPTATPQATVIPSPT